MYNIRKYPKGINTFSSAQEVQVEMCISCKLTDQVLVHIVGSYSNNGDFTEEREGDAVDSSDEAVDVLVAAGLLLAKLVAGEGQHVEVKRAEVALQLLQIFVVLLGEATLAGHVHHQRHLETQADAENGAGSDAAPRPRRCCGKQQQVEAAGRHTRSKASCSGGTLRLLKGLIWVSACDLLGFGPSSKQLCVYRGRRTQAC